MKYFHFFLIGLLTFVSFSAFSQKLIDQTQGINDLLLASSLESLKSELQLITGKETVYQNNPYLAKSVKRNLDLGIQEGIYLGHPKRVINGNTAHDLRLIYLAEKLYKCRWTFDKRDIPNLESGLQDFVSHFSKKFGPPTETIFNDTFIWEGETNRLMINYYEGTIQIEWRDDLVETKTRKLIQESS